MMTKMVNFLLIYEILTMRSIKRQKEDTKEQIACKRSKSMFESEINDELIEAYRCFFVPNKNTFINFQNENEEPAIILSYEKDIFLEGQIQGYKEFYLELLDYEDVGNLMVDKFGNLMEVVEVPLENRNLESSLYEDISSDSNPSENQNTESSLYEDISSDTTPSENEYNSFKQIVLTKIDQQETINIFDKSNKLRSMANNDVEKFLLPFTLSKSFNKNILEEKYANNVEEHMAFSREKNTDELNTIILDDPQKTSKELFSNSSCTTDVTTDTKEQLEEFNYILKKSKPSNFIKISSKHSIHEKIDAEIVEQFLDINSAQNTVEHNDNENSNGQEENLLEFLNINETPTEYTELYEGGINIPEDIPSTYIPVSNISLIVDTPSTNLSTILEPSGDLPSLCLPEVSLEPLSQDYIEMIYLKIVQNIKDTKTPNMFAEWQTSRLDSIKLFINFIKFSKSKYLHIVNSFFNLLDEKIMSILDKHKLRSNYQLEKYDLSRYNVFNFQMTETINEVKLYWVVLQYKNNFGENVLHILCFEFVQLFKYFPKFPELMTLGCLFNQGADERLILYLRLIHLIINENINRLEEIRPVVLFIIKKSFTAPDRKRKDINIKLFEKFTISEFHIVKSVCNKDHSNLFFFLWEFPPKKLKSMKYDAKVEGGFIYYLTPKNIEYFRVVLHTFIFQHIMFTEYHNIAYDRYEKLLDESFKPDKCIFCLFDEYLGFLCDECPKKT